VAATHIRQRGIEDFLPLYSVRRKWCDRVKVVNLPLFGGYVFCRCAASELTLVRSAPGVAGVVEFGDGPAYIPESEIEAVKQLVASGLPASPCPFLKEGSPVRVRTGPLSGLTGRLTNIKNQFRLVISVEMLKRAVFLEIDSEIVEPV
jgi:transcription antitermination factor NusG